MERESSRPRRVCGGVLDAARIDFRATTLESTTLPEKSSIDAGCHKDWQVDIIEKKERLHFLLSILHENGQALVWSLGPDSILYYPSRLHNPKKLFIGSDVLLQSHIWLNAVDNGLIRYDGEIHNHDEACLMNHVQISAYPASR
jgi:hypothetical protein